MPILVARALHAALKALKIAPSSVRRLLHITLAEHDAVRVVVEDRPNEAMVRDHGRRVGRGAALADVLLGQRKVVEERLALHREGGRGVDQVVIDMGRVRRNTKSLGGLTGFKTATFTNTVARTHLFFPVGVVHKR